LYGSTSKNTRSPVSVPDGDGDGVVDSFAVGFPPPQAEPTKANVT